MKRIPFFKKWLKLKKNTFTTIRLDRGTTWFEEGEVYKAVCKTEYLFSVKIVSIKKIVYASLTEEIANNDLDPPNNTLTDLRILLQKMYKPTGNRTQNRMRHLVDRMGNYYWDLDNDGCFTKLLLITLERVGDDEK